MWETKKYAYQGLIEMYYFVFSYSIEFKRISLVTITAKS